jgi:transposase
VVKKLSGDKLKILNHSNPETGMSKAYSSNLTQWQWELIELLSCRAFYGGTPAERAPLIPAAKPGGQNREVEIWSVINAIFYLLTQGCTWRNLPGDFPAWQTVCTYFALRVTRHARNWRKDGTWILNVKGFDI